MNNPTPPSPTRVRLYSHVTQSRFLHVEDALSIGKLRLFAGNYRKGQGMETYAHRNRCQSGKVGRVVTKPVTKLRLVYFLGYNQGDNNK